MESLPIPVSPEIEGNKTRREDYFGTERITVDIERRTVRGGTVTIGYQVVKQVLSIGSTAVMARLILPEHTGLINMVVVVTGFIALFNDMGLSAATIQRSEIKQDQVSALFWINVVMGFVLALMVAAMAPLVAWFNEEPRLVPVMLAIASSFIFSGFMVQHRALMKRQMRFTDLVIIDLAATVVGMVVGISSAFMLPIEHRYWALVLELLAQAPIELAALWMLCSWRPSRPGVARDVRSMLVFGGNLTGFKLVNYLARNMDNVLIGKFYGLGALGLYAKAYGILLLPLRRVNEPFASVAVPALSRLVDTPERYLRSYNRMVSSLCLLTMPLVAFMIGAADWIVITILSERWAQVSVLFALLGISGLVEPFTYTGGWLFVSQGRVREQFQWGIVSTVLTLAAIGVGLLWGPTGVAAAYGVVGLAIRTPLLFWFVGRTGPVRTRDLYRSLVPFACASITILLALLVFRLFGATSIAFVNVFLGAAITGVVGVCTLLLLPNGREALRDVKNLPSMLGNQK